MATCEHTPPPRPLRAPARRLNKPSPIVTIERCFKCIDNVNNLIGEAIDQSGENEWVKDRLELVMDAIWTYADIGLAAVDELDSGGAK